MLLQTSSMFYSYSLGPRSGTQKQRTWCVWFLWSLSLLSMFSAPLSTVSFRPWWLSSIFFHNIRLQPISIGGVYLFGPSSLVWLWKRQAAMQPSSCASERPCLRVIPPSELLLTARSRSEQLHFSVWLLLLWSWTACCYTSWGTACFIHEGKKRKERAREREKERKSISH